MLQDTMSSSMPAWHAFASTSAAPACASSASRLFLPMAQCGPAGAAAMRCCTSCAHRHGRGSSCCQRLRAHNIPQNSQTCKSHASPSCMACCGAPKPGWLLLRRKPACGIEVLWQGRHSAVMIQRSCLRRSQGPAQAQAAQSNAAQFSCPKCRMEYSVCETPQEYRCMCNAVADPPWDPWILPHSCGGTCGRRLMPDCGHDCVLLCHPGPCPPCPRQVQIWRVASTA